MEGDLAAIVTIWLAATCGYAAASKIRNVRALADQTVIKAMLGTRLARWAAPAIVATESLAAVALTLGLVLGPSLRVGSAAATLLFAVFSTGLAAALMRGITGGCGCFGESDDEPIGVGTLFRAVVLALASALLLASGPAAPATTASMVADATIGLGLVATFRLLTYAPVVVAWLRQPVPEGVTPTTRLTFKYSPLDVPLFDGDPLPVNQASVLSSDRFFSSAD